jgi:thioredoxin 1
VVQSSVPVLVDFYTDNSETSKQMVPVLAALTTDLGSSVKVFRMDANESPVISDKYNVQGVPDFVLFKNGEKIDHMVGPQTKEQMVSFLKKYVKLQLDVQPSPQTDGSGNTPPPSSGTFQG